MPSSPVALPYDDRADLEAAHGALLRAAARVEAIAPPVFDATVIGRAIEAAATSLYDLYDGRGDAAAALRLLRGEVRAASESAARAAEDDASLRGIAELLASALGAIDRADQRSVTLTAPRPPRDLRASTGGMPLLHFVGRQSMGWRLRLPPPPPSVVLPTFDPIPRPTTVEELDLAVAELRRRAALPVVRSSSPQAAAPPPAASAMGPTSPASPEGFAQEIDPAMTPLAFLQEKAREWFEEVAMVGMQRAPVLGDPWRFGGRLEERMIGALDALASIGPVAPTHVERLCRDAPLKDERVAFATAMCLGMFEGRDALGAAERLLHEHVAEVGFVAGFGAGLALAPHDRIGGAMRQLADGDDDAIAAMAVDVLGFRGLATGDELERWARRGDASLHAALRHALGVRHDGLERMATEARDHGDRTLARQAHLVAIAAGVRFASAKLDERARGEDGEAFATLLAVAGDESQATWILERALASKSPGWIAACGWAGACTSIAPLIELLAEAKDEAAFAVADALERITSAGLFEDRLLPEELIAVEDPPDPEPPAPRPQPLGRLVSDGRDKPDESAGGALPLPTIDAGRWRAWFGRENARFPVGHRARRGLPYSPLVVLGELDTARAMLGERRWMQAELVVRTGRHVRFDPHDWVARQEQALLQWGPLATSASSLPGRWSLPRRA